MALSQRFEGQAGIDFAGAVHFSEVGGAAGYLLLKQHLPKFNMKLTHLSLKEGISSLEIIDLSRQKTVYVWPLDTARNQPFYLLADGSLVNAAHGIVTRLDACSNVAWRKRLPLHINFATGEAQSPWQEAMQQHEVRTLTGGAAALFDDGGVMVEKSDYGGILRRPADGAVRWSYINRASDGRVYQLGKIGRLDAEYGAEMVRSLAACTTNPS